MRDDLDDDGRVKRVKTQGAGEGRGGDEARVGGDVPAGADGSAADVRQGEGEAHGGVALQGGDDQATGVKRVTYEWGRFAKRLKENAERKQQQQQQPGEGTDGR